VEASQLCGDAADDPDEQRESHGAVELAKDQTGSKEDAGANYRADEEEEEIALRERADEWGHFSRLVRMIDGFARRGGKKKREHFEG